MDAKFLGSEGEHLVAEVYKKHGFKLIGQNVRLFCGEIDLLMQDKNVLVVVEVKTKTDLSFGLPQEMINYKKKKKLLQLARTLWQKFPGRDIRIDAIAIDESQNKIEHIVSAVEE